GFAVEPEERAGRAPVAIEAAGHPAASAAALAHLAPAGRVVFVGSHGEQIPVPQDRIVLAELTVRGAFGYLPENVGEAGALLAADGERFARLISRRVALAEAPAAIAALRAGDPGTLKVLVEPAGSPA